MLNSSFPITRALSTSLLLTERALGAFLEFVEKKTGATLVRKQKETELQSLLRLADTLKIHGVIRRIYRTTHGLVDEPPVHIWRAPFADDDSGSGSSATSDAHALVCALAEALERYLWRYETNVFVRPITASDKEMQDSGRRFVSIARFAGFTSEQRARFKRLAIDEHVPLRWIEARDGTNERVYVPAQTASAAHGKNHTHEPLLRPIITTGLATGPTRRDALIAGALEVFERDAFMIMWLNQLTYPRIDIDSLLDDDDELRELVARAARYRLRVDAVRMVTDAPAHAVFAVVQDEAEHPEAPFIVGMGCRQSLARATAHAIREALRIRINARVKYLKQDTSLIVPEKILHSERVAYWLHDNRWRRLQFLVSGKYETAPSFEWEKDSPDNYLTRITQWCKDSGYTFTSVALGTSEKNPTTWHVESVVIPEMQPLHIREQFQCLGGARLKEIPTRYGYTPREKPFSEEPHPFA